MKKAISLGFNWVLHMDAGLTNDPKYIASFLPFLDKKYDCIKASRYIKGAKVLGVPLYRRVFSIMGNHIASTLFHVGIKDCTNGFRLIRLSKMKGITFKESSYAMILEELYYLKKKKAHFYEIPYTLKMNKTTVSHFYYSPRLFFTYFRYAFKSFFVF
jgi:dolichol-phosphate mannosyltransferase